jgi:hypothetical protein
MWLDFTSFSFLHLIGLKEELEGDLPRTFPTLISHGTKRFHIHKMNSIEA